MRNLALLASFASLAVLAACGGDDSGDDEPTIDAAPSTIVKVDCAGATVAGEVTAPGFAFTPMMTTIAVGEVVKFTMPGTHNAQSVPVGQFFADFNTTACFRFDEAGTFAFKCVPHSFTGSIVVQ